MVSYQGAPCVYQRVTRGIRGSRLHQGVPCGIRGSRVVSSCFDPYGCQLTHRLLTERYCPQAILSSPQRSCIPSPSPRFPPPAQKKKKTDKKKTKKKLKSKTAATRNNVTIHNSISTRARRHARTELKGLHSSRTVRMSPFSVLTFLLLLRYPSVKVGRPLGVGRGVLERYYDTAVVYSFCARRGGGLLNVL